MVCDTSTQLGGVLEMCTMVVSAIVTRQGRPCTELSKRNQCVCYHRALRRKQSQSNNNHKCNAAGFSKVCPKLLSQARKQNQKTDNNKNTNAQQQTHNSKQLTRNCKHPTNSKHQQPRARPHERNLET